MNPVTELKANPNAASESATVNGGAAATPSATKIPERVDFKIHSGSLLVEFAQDHVYSSACINGATISCCSLNSRTPTENSPLV